ncbi:MAG TPA: proton-conducting transporter membrane subunit [Terriglobia bacterium]|nr:proton-conducting transporter membrane subunit [Terriglobia bacterium]
MLLLLPLLIPIAGAAILLAFGTNGRARLLALAVGAAEILSLLRVVFEVYFSGPVQFGRYLRADGLSAFFLLNVALIFGLTLVYSLDYLRNVAEERFSSARWFHALLLFFVFTIVGVCLSANLGLLWIMMEATTLASASLVGFYNTKGAVEAGWKYLIVCTVGIAFALFGTIVLYLAAIKSGLSPQSALDWPALMAAVPRLGGDVRLLRLAFVFVVVGYGTKVGLVPMHSWLPDAHAEAPSPISALLSAVLLNCAMYTLLRYDAVISRASGSNFCHSLLLVFGVLSLVVAGLLMVVQKDLKRLLAYSSIEHMGIVAIGVGLGGPLGLYGALLHTFSHSLGKSMLFFTAGNVRENFGTLKMDRIGGMARQFPGTAWALGIGSLAIVGLPPFALFVSEFAILSEAFAQSRLWVAALFLFTLSVVFGGMLHHLFDMFFRETNMDSPAAPMAWSEAVPIALAAVGLLWFGLHIPAGFTEMIHRAIEVL